MGPSAHKRYRKFDPPLKRKVQQEVGTLAEDPHRYIELRGPLKGIRSYHFVHEKTQYRIAYRIVEDRSQVQDPPGEIQGELLSSSETDGTVNPAQTPYSGRR